MSAFDQVPPALRAAVMHYVACWSKLDALLQDKVNEEDSIEIKEAQAALLEAAEYWHPKERKVE